MRTPQEVEAMIRRVDNTRDDETDSEDPNEVIFQTLRWVLENNSGDDLIIDYLPENL